MDPRTYCQQSCAQLIRDRARRGADPKSLQRGIVLAYFATQQITESKFARELSALSGGRSRAQAPGLATAARAVLRDWQRRRRAQVTAT